MFHHIGLNYPGICTFVAGNRKNKGIPFCRFKDFLNICSANVPQIGFRNPETLDWPRSSVDRATAF